MREIENLRAEIDRIDASIVELLKERMKCVYRVGEIKQEQGSPLFVPERESAQREKLAALNAGVLPEDALLNIYRQIISCGYLVEGGLRVGYLGPEGTWSHQAALARFGESAELTPYHSFEHVFAAAEREEINYAVVPIENSTAGFVAQAMDLLMTSDCLRICAQSMQSIRNCLLGNIEPEEIKVIYSHPQVLGQCRLWLQQNYPNAEQISTASTAAAAKIALREADRGAAALGSQLVADLYGLKVLQNNVQDIATNTTRFAIIGKQNTQPTGKDRTTICFGVPHTAGTLADALILFKNHSINIYCIDSRPSRHSSWEYLFSVDVEGHEGTEPLESCLKDLRQHCPMVKVLGSYPEL